MNDSAAATTPRLRALDFTPFEQALAEFSVERAATIDSLVRDQTLTEIQAALQSGALTSQDLTLYCLDRIRRFDESLRTFLEINPFALDEARAADTSRASGAPRGPLHGIPVNLKDNIETAGPMHTTAGAELLLDHVAGADAPLVSRLRAAGAVILGKANLSEFAGAISITPGYSAIGGQVQNPHGPQFTPYGSSAGSCASVAACLALASVGSETSGSLIAPASVNGVVALYPGRGVIEGTGVIPLLRNNDSAGPIGRSVTDVALLLNVIAAQPGDFAAGLDADALQAVPVGLLASEILNPGPATQAFEDTTDNPALLERLERALAAAGALVRPAALGGDRASFDQAYPTVFFIGFGFDLFRYLQAVGARATTPAELVAYNLEAPERRIATGQQAAEVMGSVSGAMSEADYDALIGQFRALAASILDATFAESGADVLVSLNNYSSPYYATANYPAVTVPLGLRSNGMPAGATFIGRAGSESRLLACAYAFEQSALLRVNPVLDRGHAPG